MSSRIWYTAQCLGCMTEPRVFDLMGERNRWANDHVVIHQEDKSHKVTFGRTKTPPTYRPKVNCALCIQFGTQSPAAAEVYESAVCRDHVGIMQTAGAMTNRVPGLVSLRPEALALARAILSHTKPIGKQED